MTDTVPRLPDWVQPGVSFRQEVGSKDRHFTYHIRGIVDGQAVLRRWAKGHWDYKCEGWEYFNIMGPFLRVVETTK